MYSEVWLQNIVKSGKYSHVKFANSKTWVPPARGITGIVYSILPHTCIKTPSIKNEKQLTYRSLSTQDHEQ